LRERPRSGFALYGIAMCSEKSGDSKAAAKEYGDFLAAWKGADPALAQVTHAHAYVAEHAAVAAASLEKTSKFAKTPVPATRS
jgi:hypothetical protein